MLNRIIKIVTIGAGLAATAKTIYDWRRDRQAEQPVISATCQRHPSGALLLNLDVVRCEHYNLFMHKIRGHGFKFSKPSLAGYPEEWKPGEFFDELTLDWLVSSAVSAPRSTAFPYLPIDSRSVFVTNSVTSRRMIDVKVLISNNSRRSRERWKRITTRISD